MSTAPVKPRRAATIVLMRAGKPGIQVLMLRRHGNSGFAANRWVFPGGTVDDADRALPEEHYRGIRPHELQERFADDPDTVLGFHVAAVRETFEEAGVLLADGAVETEAAKAARAALIDRNGSGQSFNAFLERHGLVLNLGALTYTARWITPRISPRRYDTAFFLAEIPAEQVAEHDEFEITAKQWVGTGEALDAFEAGTLEMMKPTVSTIRWLSEFDTPDAAVAAAASQPVVPWNLPHVYKDEAGRRISLSPTDPEYPHSDYADELRGPIQ